MNNKNITIYSIYSSEMSEVYKKSSQYLSNYYNNYDINTVFVHKDENTRIKNAIDNFTNRGLPFWWSITVSRFLLLQSFLESDSDYFVLQDLDNIVINKDLNIRDELTAEWICPWWKYKSLNEPDCFYRDPRNIRKFHNQSYMLSKHKSIDLYTQPHHHVCADFIGASREVVENIIKFYNGIGCNTEESEKFCDFIMDVVNNTEAFTNIEKGIQEEELFATYITASEDTPQDINQTNIRYETWYIDNENWSRSIVDLISQIKEGKKIFAHLGSCDKLNFFSRVVEQFKC